MAGESGTVMGGGLERCRGPSLYRPPYPRQKKKNNTPSQLCQIAAMSSLPADMQAFLSIVSRVYGDPPAAPDSNWRPRQLSPVQPRYLWTDAFGVVNYITLFKESGNNPVFLDMADALIVDVHNTLGRHRHGGSRLGDSTDQEPLRGGLRIGKVEEEGEEDGDGQYFHYLTKWMFALNRMSIARGDEHYNDLAIQLAKSVHPHFVHGVHKERPRMFWKMSIDLSKPWVLSEGNLDPYDGYMTYRILAHHCTRSKDILSTEIAQMKKIVLNKYKHYKSQDPLDLGEALWICHWFLNEGGIDNLGKEDWARQVTTMSLQALEMLYSAGLFTKYPSAYRLAFREFGTTIGVQVNPLADKNAWMKRVKDIHEYWKDKLFVRDSDITPVMYCTSLNPGAFRSSYF